MAASRLGQGATSGGCGVSAAGEKRLPPLGEASTRETASTGAAFSPRERTNGAASPSSVAPVRPGTRDRIDGREPLPGVMPFGRGELVSAPDPESRDGGRVVDRVKAIVWTENGWAAVCILAGVVPLAQIRRRERAYER